MGKPLKKKIKGGTDSFNMSKSPLCPVHMDPMRFVSDEGRFRCPHLGCKQAAFPARLANGTGEPIVGAGPFELVIMPAVDGNAPQTFLRSMPNNIMLDITDLIDAATRGHQGFIGVQMTVTNVLYVEK